MTTKSFISQSIDVLPMVGVAIAGASLTCIHRHGLRWRDWFLMLSVSGFGAYIFGFAASDFGIPENAAFAMCGCIGLSGGKMVENFITRAQNRIGEMIDNVGDVGDGKE